MAMGERTPVAVLDAPASGRLAVGEALTNILAADIGSLSNVRLSANWMAACGEPGEDAALYATVHAVGEELCPALGIAIPVGKDSLSMKTVWGDGAAPQVGGRARVADHHGVRAGGRRAQDLDAAAAHRSRRDRRCCSSISAAARTASAARRSRRCTASSARRRADLDDPALLTPLAAALRGAARAEPGAGLSRPLRRRRVRHAGRDGVRRPLRPRRRTTGRRERRGGRAVLRRAGRRAAGEGRRMPPRRRRCSRGTGSAS